MHFHVGWHIRRRENPDPDVCPCCGMSGCLSGAGMHVKGKGANKKVVLEQQYWKCTYKPETEFKWCGVCQRECTIFPKVCPVQGCALIACSYQLGHHMDAATPHGHGDVMTQQEKSDGGESGSRRRKVWRLGWIVKMKK